MRAAGVYQIRNTANGKIYVGSAVDMRRRWYEHASRLRSGKHHSIALQRAWYKYGGDAFVFSPLLICSKSDILFYEQRALDALRPEYNMSPTAGNSAGVKHSAETRARMSAANSGKKLSEVHKARIAESNRGGTRTEETKKRMAEARTGTTHSPETRAKLSRINAEKTMPAEVRAKISAKLKGTPKPERSEGHRAALSAANKGVPKKPFTEEHKRNMSIAAKNRRSKV